jgi:mRNA interferase MazF
LRRGEVYWADLAPRSGSEQQGRRPVIIVSNDQLNQIWNWKSLIVVPLSTSATQRTLPLGTAGLPKECVALCHQLTTLDRSKFVKRIGRLNLMRLNELEDGLKAALDLI